MWEDNDAEDEDEDEEEGLAGQLLSDLIASNKYGTTNSSCISPLVFPTSSLFYQIAHTLIHVGFCVTDDDYYEDDEEDDPDALKDPIYQIDLQVHSLWILSVLTTLISWSSVKPRLEKCQCGLGLLNLTYNKLN